MKKENKNSKRKQLRYGIVCALVIGMMVSYMTLPRPVLEQNPDTGTWEILFEGSIASAAEAAPGDGASGWLSIWCYEHGNTADLSTNATIWDPDEGGHDAPHDVYAYAHADSFSEDLAAATAFDIVVRCRFNYANCGYNADKFDSSRTRVSITATCPSWGDGEDVTVDVDYGNVTESYNTSGADYIYINFHWSSDDGNGFKINPDATLTISTIKIEAKY